MDKTPLSDTEIENADAFENDADFILFIKQSILNYAKQNPNKYGETIPEDLTLNDFDIETTPEFLELMHKLSKKLKTATPEEKDLFLNAIDKICAAQPTDPVQDLNPLMPNSANPYYYNSISDALSRYNYKKSDLDTYNDVVISQNPDGYLKITDYSELKGDLTISSKKLFDALILKFTQSVFYSSNKPSTMVKISVDEYANISKKELKTPKSREKFVESIYNDLRKLYKASWTTTAANKNNRLPEKDFEVRLIQSWYKDKNIFYIRLSEDLAISLSQHPFVALNFPTNLLALGNKNPNSYLIGRKIALHNNIDNNITRGTENTLKVSTLLSVSELPTLDDLKRSGQRNWKRLIKEKFETALNDNIKANVLSRWQYRDKNGNTYTPEQAGKLKADEYMDLVVDYVIVYPKEAQERRKERIETLEKQKEEKKHKQAPKKSKTKK